LFVVLMVIVVIAIVGFWFSRQPTEPAAFSIDRSVIKNGENATLTVTVKNLDLKRHFVEYRFEVNDKVSIYEGAEELLPRAGLVYTFNYTLEATIPSETRVFVVVGTLEGGISSATYPISLAIYFDEDEIEKTWNDLNLKVEE
jgi:hypothetical protein